MSDIFKNKEVVFFSSNGEAGYGDYEGQECRIVGTLKEYSVIRGGKRALMEGYAVQFTFNNRECIVLASHLERLTPKRGDMDRILTWDYVHETIGWRPRDGE